MSRRRRPRLWQLAAAGTILAIGLTISPGYAVEETGQTGSEADSAGAAAAATVGQRLAQLLADPPVARGECRGSVQGPFLLPPRPRAAAIGVIFADGRLARWDSLRVLGAESYWPLELACSALGATLMWDAQALCGELLIDTLRCRFAVGAEIIHCRDHPIQLTGPVLYLENRLLVPASFAPRVAAAQLPQRFAFDPDSLVLMHRPPGPLLRGLLIQEYRGRTYLRWELDQEPQAVLRTDGVGNLIIDLPGVYVDPLEPPAPEPRPGACLQLLCPHPRGTRFVFAVSPAVVGWQSEWRADRGEYRVILSDDRADLDGWNPYRPWPGSAAEGAERPTSASGPIVLVVPDPSGGALREIAAEEREALRFVSALGERIATVWRSLGGAAEIVRYPGHSARSPWAAAANARRGAACVCLLPDFVGARVAEGYRIVTGPDTPAARPLLPLTAEEPRTAGETSQAVHKLVGGDQPPLEFRPWHAVAAEHARDSEQLGWMLALHLRAAAPDVPVHREHWPAIALRGLDTAGVILYVGGRESQGTFPGDLDELTLGQTAEAVALALEAFQMRRGSQER